MTNFVSNYQKIKGFSSGVQIKLIAKMSTKEGELFVVKSHFTFLDAKIDSPYSTIKKQPMVIYLEHEVGQTAKTEVLGSSSSSSIYSGCEGRQGLQLYNVLEY